MERFVESLVRDRRLAERHALRMPMQLRLRASDKREEKVEAENVSRRGVFFWTDLPLDKGSTLDLLLEMPERISGVRPAQWVCLGHVVRVVERVAHDARRGIGVEFDFYVVAHTTAPRWEFGPGLRGPLRP
jgi:PilZ domain-containing protein